MRVRQLLTASIFYGISDMLVMAVGGFLLLPLYTRTLSQADFGIYFIVRANTDLLLYILYLGLPSAITRLYFDYRPSGRQFEYLNSILMFFLLYAALTGLVLALWGRHAWHLLSPTTPAFPYIWYSFAVAASGFLSAVGALVLRLEEKIKRFIIIQLAASAMLAVASFVGLKILHLGLPGLFASLVVGYTPAALSLVYMIGRHLRPRINRNQLWSSLTYGSPFVVTYISFFFLNRFSTLVLQHHVGLAKIAIFGLAQQLATIITIASGAFGKALQPNVFGATAEKATEVLRRSTRLFIVLMFCVTAALMCFSKELVAIVAPHRYDSSAVLMLVLVAGNFAQALCLISSMTLEYFKKPSYSAAVTMVGAVLSAGLSLFLIPRYSLVGAAAASSIGYLLPALLGHLIAYRLSKLNHFSMIAFSLVAVCAVAVAVFFTDGLGLAWWAGFGLRAGILLAAVMAAGLAFAAAEQMKLRDITAQFRKAR